ncbi:hypothetical protein BDV59DRAFT_51382 [Aspergillus ambiguus]|uniref:uncharacterized protein n=1 Tax=Aspergillus ambiguus TaxID=176160 RepID=UPI003CCD89AB
MFSPSKALHDLVLSHSRGISSLSIARQTMEEIRKATRSLDDWVGSRIDHSIQDPNVGFVETLYQNCSTALVHLWKSRLRYISCDSRRNILRKDIANIRLWEENFPPSYLDTILEQSPRLKANVLENLKGIGIILVRFFESCDERYSTQDLAQELETQLEKAAIILSAEEISDYSSEDDSSDDSSSNTEREQNLYGRLHCYVNCLMDVAPVIERQLFSMQQRVEGPSAPLKNEFRLSQSAQPFAMRIRDRFAMAPIPLVERLAVANWERSVRVRGRQEGLSDEADATDHDVVTYFKPYSIIDSGIGTSIITRPQYAATTASHTSYLSIAVEDANDRPRVPPLPREDGRHFQCKYCRKTISMRDRVEWKMHVFADLQSYLCTHEECEDSLKTFPSRKLWADHEFTEHFTQLQWRCFTCNIGTLTQQSFVHHLITSHDITLTGHRLAAAILEAKEEILKPEFKDHKCALCSQGGWQTRKAYTTHMGQHLEEISLACLPIDEGSSSEVDSEDDAISNATKSSMPNSYKAIYNEALGWDQDAGHLTEFLGSPAPIDPAIRLTKQNVSNTSATPPYMEPEHVPTGVNVPSHSIHDNSMVSGGAGDGTNSVAYITDLDIETLKRAEGRLLDPQNDLRNSRQDPGQNERPKEKGNISSAQINVPQMIDPSSKPTSYWTVSEQRAFPQLLSHFGRDFEALSRFLGTKTPSMVKNYFQRRIDSGQKDFEDIVANAEAKKALGRQTGPLPAPFARKPEQRRHKRTRSGCFTCRSHRVKCDEARPVCNQCRKGNLDCVYPVLPMSRERM